MKKTIIILLALLMLSISSATAQSHIGKWMADQEFSKMVNNTPNMAIDLFLVFTAKDINVQLGIKAEDEGMTMTFLYTIPGTYTNYTRNSTTRKAAPLDAASPSVRAEF